MSVQPELLLNLVCEVSTEFEIQMKKTGNEFSYKAMQIISQIREEPGITISEIARRTGIAKSYVFRIVKELYQKEWIEKKADSSDQRILRLYFNQSGIEHVKKISVRQWIEDALENVEKDRVNEMIAGLKEFKATLVNLNQV